MLQNDLYTIQDWRAGDNAVETTLFLRPDHSLFEGHFPGQPVLPGACMLQMIKEIMETALNMHLQLTNAPAMKFLQRVIPDGNTPLQAVCSWRQQEDRSIAVRATLSIGTKPCFIFSGGFLPA